MGAHAGDPIKLRPKFRGGEGRTGDGAAEQVQLLQLFKIRAVPTGDTAGNRVDTALAEIHRQQDQRGNGKGLGNSSIFACL